MLTLKIKGLDDLQRQIDDFSQRRMAAATATALTRTAHALRAEWKDELSRHINQPTTLTQNAPVVRMATAQNLMASVRMRDQVTNGTAPAEYLKPLEYGGGREHKKFERALIEQGSMPSGTYAVPTDFAKRDAYGNVARGQLVQILVQLAGGTVREGYRRVISASATRRAQAAIRAGREYVAVLQQQGKLYPGIYARVGAGLRMVFSFERRVFYRRQLSLADRAQRKAQEVFDKEMRRAVEESAARLKARSA